MDRPLLSTAQDGSSASLFASRRSVPRLADNLAA
uniref:Uncharacterized protein n=1 Tax=Zea mays TaxID=4577 RepID=C4J2B9_MAIZE|nr:unknown [Zea mays]